jgi:hypothetical protein
MRRPLLPGDHVYVYCPMPRMEGDEILGRLKRRGPFRGFVEMGLLTGRYPIKEMRRAD